jgi:hypothetical protein
LGEITYYFRSHFTLPAPPTQISQLELATLIDDGAVIYLNGSEVLRLRMPENPIDALTFANATVSNAAIEGPFLLPPETLREGDNVLAIEVHQHSSDSSDIVCGAELDATFLQDDEVGDWLANGLALLNGLRVTELMYHAPAGADLDYIELQNIGNVPLDLDGVRFTAGIHFVFPATILAPGEYVLVADNITAFQNEYGSPAPLAGSYSGSLSNKGERLVLQLPHPLDAAIHRIDYSDQWHPSTDGLGDSLAIISPLLPLDLWNDSDAWTPAAPTPGRSP